MSSSALKYESLDAIYNRPDLPSKSSLGYNTNPQYPQFPPKMHDGRSVISSWQPETAINEHLIKEHNIQSNWMYRKYLTENGTKLMEYNFKEACNDTGYIIPTNYSSPPADNLQPTSEIQSSESDLRHIYLTREQLNTKKVTPVITQEQLLRNQ
jgi:hypothetical protein